MLLDLSQEHLYVTKDQLEELRRWVQDHPAFRVIGDPDPAIRDLRVLEATPAELDRIAAGEDWVDVIGSDEAAAVASEGHAHAVARALEKGEVGVDDFDPDTIVYGG